MSENDKLEFDAALEHSTRAIAVPVEPPQRDRMFAHYLQVIEANRRFNLTRITAPADAAVKHYADSLSLLATGWASPSQRLTLLDVGTGAGFPAVPLAITCPDWTVTAIDGTGKKANFVTASAGELGLSNLSARHARVEDLVRQGGRRFDIVVVRAVGKIADLLGDLQRLVEWDGRIVFYKTAQVAGEWAAAEAVASKLRYTMSMHHLELWGLAEPLARELVCCRRRS